MDAADGGVGAATAATARKCTQHLPIAPQNWQVAQQRSRGAETRFFDMLQTIHISQPSINHRAHRGAKSHKRHANSSACDRRLSHDPQTSRRHEHTIQTSMARASDGRRPERRGSPLALTTAESSTAQAETTISNQHSVGRCRRQHQERRNSPAPDLSPSSSAASPRASPHAASIAGSRAGGAGSRPACRRLSARSEARPSDGRDGHRYVSSAGWRRHPRPGQSTRRGPQGR
jgi:hypothetical protein